jgi:hypothetical protein
MQQDPMNVNLDYSRASNGNAPILTTILQKSLNIQGIHYNWKTSHVVPIYIYKGH